MTSSLKTAFALALLGALAGCRGHAPHLGSDSDGASSGGTATVIVKPHVLK